MDEASGNTDVPLHKELPLPDYDHIPAGTLPSRISGLEEGDVAQLITYEKAHGNRLPILTILEKRLHDLRGAPCPADRRLPARPRSIRGSLTRRTPPTYRGPQSTRPRMGIPPTRPSRGAERPPMVRLR